ncbi:hypothetical protein LSAT2_010144, partial [Lamellibrachia satsuma]
QQQQQHYSAVWKPPSETEQFASIPWSFSTFPLKSRRPRFSNEKTHACDSPGCRKTFYDRGNMLRHQRLKHGRKAQFSRKPSYASTEFVLAVHDGPMSSQSGAVLSSQSDVMVPSESAPVSQSHAIPPSQGDVMASSQNAPFSQTNATPPSQSDVVTPSQS